MFLWLFWENNNNHLSLYIYIYIYMHAVESKLGPKIAFFESKLGPSFLFFSFLFFFSKIFFFLQGEWDFKEKRAKTKTKKTPFLSQNLVHFCCATYLDQVLTQPWTKFWLNIFANFWVFLPVWKDAETTIFIVFSAKNEIFKPTPKIKNTICEHNCANWFFCLVFLHFCFFGFLLCPVFWGSFFERNENKKKTKFKTKQQKTKKEEGPQDATKKTT